MKVEARLFGKPAGRTIDERFRKPDDAAQRGSQLMGGVGQEFIFKPVNPGELQIGVCQIFGQRLYCEKALEYRQEIKADIRKVQTNMLILDSWGPCTMPFSIKKS